MSVRTPVTTKVPLLTAKEPTDRMSMRSIIDDPPLPACPSLESTLPTPTCNVTKAAYR